MVGNERVAETAAEVNKLRRQAGFSNGQIINVCPSQKDNLVLA